MKKGIYKPSSDFNFEFVAEVLCANPNSSGYMVKVKTTAHENTGTSSLTMPTPMSEASGASPDSPNFSETDLETSSATASGATSVEATNTVGGTIGGVSSKTSPDTVSEVISVKTTARGNTGTSSLTMATATSGALGVSPDSQNFSESDLEKSPATVLEAKPNRKRYLTRSIGDARPFSKKLCKGASLY